MFSLVANGLMNVLLFAFALLLALKPIWNVIIPIWFMVERRNSGVSLCPHLELGFFLAMLLISISARGNTILHHTGSAAIWGGGAMIGSWLVLIGTTYLITVLIRPRT